MARKKKSTRPLRPVLPYIIGAGITEKYYFGHLKRECNYQVEVRPKFFEGFSETDFFSSAALIVDADICRYSASRID